MIVLYQRDITFLQILISGYNNSEQVRGVVTRFVMNYKSLLYLFKQPFFSAR